MNNNEHLWRGTLINEKSLEAKLADSLDAELTGLLEKRLDLDVLFSACEQVFGSLSTPTSELFQNLEKVLLNTSSANEFDRKEALEAIAGFIKPENLHEKIKKELGSRRAFAPLRTRYDKNIFECWAPLGFLVHIAPSNALTVGTLSVLEGLLAGNINFLKTSAHDSLLAQYFFKALCDADETNHLRDFVMIGRFSSKNTSRLKRILSLADGVAAWGGEESVAGVRGLCAPGVRFVDWGPKISFAYICQSQLLNSVAMQQVASDICVLDQQACSSPQVIYLETQDRRNVENFARSFAKILDQESAKKKANQPDFSEQAEITSVSELVRLGECIDNSENILIHSSTGDWRVFVEFKPALRASPLYRSIWIKPLPQNMIIRVLHPMRNYLQTVGIAGNADECTDVMRVCIQAGAQRFTTVGRMHESYMGEPHDGRYALQAYARKISMQLDSNFEGISNLDDLGEKSFVTPVSRKLPLMGKEDFQKQIIEDRYAHLFFKSGGSSGEAKLSIFTYEDYHAQMQAAAEGLYAAGLNPAKDRCMNLFFGGGLYGGFVSFFTILEDLNAVQFPMASVEDHKLVAQTIAKYRVNVLLGMPSYINKLFDTQSDVLRKYGGVEKIFYGGEHFSEAQRQKLRNDFGMNSIISAAYGSVDAGPLGFQCIHCDGSIHHLHTSLQSLEILKMTEDRPTDKNEVGRLIFSSRMRQGQSLVRYEIGDLGRWVDTEACLCGRRAPRFELLGRYGDIARIGTTYLSYQKVLRIMDKHFSYSDDVQIILSPSQNGLGREGVEILVSERFGESSDLIVEAIKSEYKDVGEVVAEGLLSLNARCINAKLFQRSPSSSKLIHIIDLRKNQ